jgi:hypothetical protein
VHLKALLELGVPHARDERSLGHVLGRVRCPRELAAGAEGARHNRWYRPDVDEEDDVLDLWEHVVCLGVSGVFTTYVTHTHTLRDEELDTHGMHGLDSSFYVPHGVGYYAESAHVDVEDPQDARTEHNHEGDLSY